MEQIKIAAMFAPSLDKFGQVWTSFDSSEKFRRVSKSFNIDLFSNWTSFNNFGQFKGEIDHQKIKIIIQIRK